MISFRNAKMSGTYHSSDVQSAAAIGLFHPTEKNFKPTLRHGTGIDRREKETIEST